MPLYDVQCNSCGFTEEVIAPINQDDFVCSRCGKHAHKIITLSETHSFDDNAPWIRSVLDVVEKGSGKQHCEEFLRNPTRQNYKAWMKGEGIHPMEKHHGSFRSNRETPKTDIKPVVKVLAEKRAQRNRIYFSGS